ncbi:putative ATP-grasp-modified RiPP [Actinacidiphila epipremni]|jgi:putative ATP-grasp target RiPP|uniref:ATP-grasp-modified RiPP n=1 Tax=Actinacidiphila epipremni TaxID=2053013 RepID=A0ABX0ZMF5_9ACTN|nr:putative ATP-grasp-modified RiPP [Actinacidiphila epipremni]NJP45065.1 putative ATP-grasp-modified RiPP [Actinacidiphila epipremni]
MQQTAARPWAIGRMRPYPRTTVQPFATVEIDPATQLGVFRDAGGLVVEMGKHGTSKGTETNPQSTNLDSRNDSDHDQDSTQD